MPETKWTRPVPWRGSRRGSHSIPFVLAFFLFLAWISLSLQRASYSYVPPHSSHTDIRANLVRFGVSEVAKDKRGWIFDPIALALASGISGTIIVGCNWNTTSFFIWKCLQRVCLWFVSLIQILFLCSSNFSLRFFFSLVCLSFLLFD